MLVSVDPSLAPYRQKALSMHNVVLEISVPAPIQHQKRLGAMLAADETSYRQQLDSEAYEEGKRPAFPKIERNIVDRRS